MQLIPGLIFPRLSGASLSTTVFCVSLCMRVFSLPWACLVHTKWSRPSNSINASWETNSQSMADKSWWVTSQLLFPQWDTSVLVFIYSLRAPQWNAHKTMDNPIRECTFYWPSSLFSLLCSLTVLPSQINCLHRKLCLGLCFCRNQIITVINNKRWWVFRISLLEEHLKS